MSSKGVVFLTGVGRSGTTVLQRMLHAHSQINFSVETHFFKRYVMPFLSYGKRVKKNDLIDDRFLKRLEAAKQKQLSAINYGALEDYQKAMRIIMGPATGSDVSYLGDKDTEYVRYLPHLKAFMPDSFLLHIIRDPRDVIASRLKTEWGARRSFLFHVAEYHYYIKELRKWGPRLFGNRYLEIKYEDLLQNPVPQLQKITGALHLSYEEDMLHYHTKKDNLVAQDEKSWKQNVSKPLNQANTGKWRNAFDKSEVAVIEWGMENFMDEMGYKRQMATTVSSGAKAKLFFYTLLFAGKSWKERLKKDQNTVAK